MNDTEVIQHNNLWQMMVISCCHLICSSSQILKYTINVRHKKLFMGSLFHQKLESSFIAGNNHFNYKAQSKLEKLLLH